MALRYLLDEHLRGLFWHYVLQYNVRHTDPLNVIRVGDPADLPLGTEDPEILSWCERENRILVSMDRSTLPDHLREHVARGGRSPGIFIVREVPVMEAVEFLALADFASEPEEWDNQVHYIP
jgi:hypothetical protein